MHLLGKGHSDEQAKGRGLYDYNVVDDHQHVAAGFQQTGPHPVKIILINRIKFVNRENNKKYTKYLLDQLPQKEHLGELYIQVCVFEHLVLLLLVLHPRLLLPKNNNFQL